MSLQGATSGLRGLALEEQLELERVTVDGDNEVPHLMETRCRAITVKNRNQKAF